MNVGNTIRRIRLEKEMTQQELAKRVEVTQSMITQIERGTKIPTLVLACNIADALGCSVTDLTEEIL